MARITKKEKSDGLYRAILTLQNEEEVWLLVPSSSRRHKWEDHYALQRSRRLKQVPLS